MSVTEQIENKNHIIDMILMNSNFQHLLEISEDKILSGKGHRMKVNLDGTSIGEDNYKMRIEVLTNEVEFRSDFIVTYNKHVQIQIQQHCTMLIRKMLMHGLMRKL